MAQKKREMTGEGTLRLSTIIEQRKIRPLEAAAVMRAHGLKPTDRLEPEKFQQLIEDWRRAPAGER